MQELCQRIVMNMQREFFKIDYANLKNCCIIKLRGDRCSLPTPDILVVADNVCVYLVKQCEFVAAGYSGCMNNE